MMKVALQYVMLIVLLALTGFAGCSRMAPEPELPALTADEVDGARLWERMTGESDYRTYSEWPGHAGLQPGQSPHGVWHRVSANRNLFDALPLSDSIAPAGTIIVKENFDNSRELKNLTVMAKVDSWDPDNGDWFWGMYGPDGTVLAEGSLGGCISCHEGMKVNDYVVINPLNEEP